MNAPQPPVARKALMIAAVLLGVGYLVTWVFGVPRAISLNDMSVVASFQRVSTHGDRQDLIRQPTFFTVAAFPALPGVVVSVRTYTISRRYSWGGVQADFWWPNQVRPWFRVTLWES